MPNQPKTKMRGFRPPPDIWDRVVQEATERGETFTAVIVRALRRYFGLPDEGSK